MHNHAQPAKLIASFTYQARQGAHFFKTAYCLSYCPPPQRSASSQLQPVGPAWMVFTPCRRPGLERHVAFPRPGGTVGVISPGRWDRCVYRDTACLPLGPCCTCKHRRVMGSSRTPRASPGQPGCVYASQCGQHLKCVCVCV